MSPVRNERCTTLSIVLNFRCFEGSLVVFDSGYCGACILVGDVYLPGIIPGCKQLYFLENQQNRNYLLCLFDWYRHGFFLVLN
jgi:hypothetical protein